MPDSGMGAAAIIGMVGGIVGLFSGVAALYDRFYKVRPLASLTTEDSAYSDTKVLVRITNPTRYDLVILGSSEKRSVYFLAEDYDTGTILKSQTGKAPHFVLKPDESKELIVMARYANGVPVEITKSGRIAFWIAWRRGNATWWPQIPVPVLTTIQTVRQLGQVDEGSEKKGLRAW